MWFTKIFSKTSLSLSLFLLSHTNLLANLCRSLTPLSHFNSHIHMLNHRSSHDLHYTTYIPPSLSLSLSLYLSNTLSRAHKATYCILSELKLKRENNFQSFSPISIFFAFSSNVRRPLRSCQFLSNKHFLNVSSSHSRSST